MSTKQVLGPLQERCVSALESGRYKQGKGLLARREGGKVFYCCLGVWAVVLRLPYKKEKTLIWFGDPTKSAYGRSDVVAPPELRERLALFDSSGGPDLSREGESFSSLTHENDEVEKSFKEIAALIRRDPSVYFDEPK